MTDPEIKFRKIILVCTNTKESGEPCCGARGGADLHKKIKEAVRAVDPTVRVSKIGCLGTCKSGVNVVIMPDDLWLGNVTEEDIPEIVKLATK